MKVLRGSTLLAPLVWLALLSGCNYARMTDDEARQTHEVSLPPLPAHTVPVHGGTERVRAADPKSLKRAPVVSPQLVAQGKAVYGQFCVHCHGPQADGNGTVGQSFSPLPADLAGPVVRAKDDGTLFSEVSLGFRRHPPLADTVSEGDRWAVVAWLRTLPPRPAPPNR